MKRLSPFLKYWLLCAACLLFLQGGGLLFILQYQKQWAHHRMTVAMEQGNTTCQILTLSAVQYVQCLVDKHELLYQGNMYDIQSVQRNADSVRCRVVHDRHEERILHRIISILGKWPDAGSSFPELVKKLLQLFYTCTRMVHFSVFVKYQSIHDIGIVHSYTTRNLSPGDPPPEKIFI